MINTGFNLDIHDMVVGHVGGRIWMPDEKKIDDWIENKHAHPGTSLATATRDISGLPHAGECHASLATMPGHSRWDDRDEERPKVEEKWGPLILDGLQRVRREVGNKYGLSEMRLLRGDSQSSTKRLESGKHRKYLGSRKYHWRILFFFLFLIGTICWVWREWRQRHYYHSSRPLVRKI